jgi:DUF1365 family protein
MGAAWASALYDGTVLHKRRVPRRHSLRYRLFWMLFDLDELDALHGGLRLFSRNRFNLLSFHDRDHLDGSAVPLRAQVEAALADAAIAFDGGPIHLLCMPRLFGHVFNPLSVYLCHRRDGGVAAVLYEVNNTFGQRHCYLAPTGEGGGTILQRAEKAFYVSPFMDMGLTYRFRVEPPAAVVAVTVHAGTADGPVLATSFRGHRRALSDATLLRAVIVHPLMTLKVVAGIHWEALKIWRKGVALRPRPPAPARPITIGTAEPR